jgi:hypothetical protein
MLRFLALAAALALGAAPALAAEKSGDPGSNVDMPFLIAPMSKDGKLLGYSYISTKLVASSRSAALAIRDKIAFVQDAFVRDVNAAPVAMANDATAVDIKLLADRLAADARRVVGAARVVRIVFGDGDKDTGISFAPLHPIQTPMRAGQEDQVPPPAPAAAPAQTAAAPNAAR